MQNHLERQGLLEQTTPVNRSLKKLGIIIPTYNAAPFLPKLLNSFAMAGIHASQVLVIDSSSSDETRALAKRAGYHVMCIPQEEFNHGGTRQLAATHMPDCERLLFCTQDVVLHDSRTIEALSAALDDESVGAAYGRQLPREEANPIERHARLFSYPGKSQLRSLDHRFDLGIRTISLSNSFAIYRRSALDAIGGFPTDILIAEDMIVAAKMLLAGWRVAYKADAIVVHSHPVHLAAQFHRYFDTGAQHARSPWVMKTFGVAYSEGTKFLKSEMLYLLANAPLYIPLALLSTINKFVAYRLGLMERYLPTKLKEKLSDYPHFWSKFANEPEFRP